MNLKSTIMNKKNLLLLFVGILSGTFFAYAGEYMVSKPNFPKKASKNAPTNRHPPGVVEKELVTNEDNSSANSFFSEEEEFMECLYRYSLMTPEDIRKEWLKLDQNFKSNTASNSEIAKIKYLAMKWGRSSPKHALQELNQKPYHNDSFLRLVMNDWVKRDPETALAYIIENKNDFAGPYTVDILASHAPLDLIEWIKTDTLKKSSLLDHAIDALPPEKMSALTSGMGKCDTLGDWQCKAIASKWAKIDCDASIRWVNSLSNLSKETKEQILEITLPQLPPDKALSEMEKRGIINKIPSLAGIADSLSQKSPEKALDWFLSQVTDEQIETIDGDGFLLSFVNAYDPQMISYAQQLPPGKKKDAVLKKMATTVWGDWRSGRECNLNAPSLDKRMDLAAQISTQDKRDATIQSILEEHISSKPKKVMEWVEKSALPAEKKQQYINQCKMSIKRAEMPYDS